jgi:transposase
LGYAVVAWCSALKRRKVGPGTDGSAIRRRHVSALEAAKTTVTQVYGIGPLTAAIIVGRVGDVRRFPTAGHFARHNGTAPIEASSEATHQRRRLATPHR